ncbi:hypothetical protein CVD28_15910 [Bacillus sp. M6-12]|uniref:hypothetical protein n=1 Tax=Bacillus sp. M6-12 TaxID=2054166 RepID=UPI000C789702|nr:hypothetical protein [Bacillus sp. M6-12]PLS16568.1 hypothetical protein CVD28_15910 [Bacillus sp. M6-12]
MVRTFLSILLMLSAVLGGMLFWQWHGYSEKRDKSTEINAPSAVQSFKIINAKGVLTIEQTIKGLPAGKYTVENPNNFKWVCTEGEKSNCTPKDNGKKEIRTNGKQLVFSYSIPLRLKQPSFVLTNWSLSLNNTLITKTRVELTEGTSRKGIWAAGAPLLANKEKDFIDYYVFEGEGEAYPLYYHSGKLTYTKISDSFEVYGELNPEQADRLKGAASKFTDYPFLTVIATNKHPEYHSGHLMITSSLQGLEQNLLTQYLQFQYVFSDKQEAWLQGYIGQLLFGQKSGLEKVNQLNKYVKAELTEDQQSSFIELIKEENSDKYSALLLDSLLSKAAGKKTSFFTENRISAKPIIPLYFIVEKQVLINGNEIKGERAIFYKNQKFYPFEAVSAKLGYAINKVNPKHYLLSRDSNMYRLYLDKSSFLFNDKAYGVAENPFVTLNGKVYIGEIWLNDIFKTFVRENEAEVEIVEL